VGDTTQRVERVPSVDVAGVNDQIHPLENLKQARWKLIRELRAVRIRDDADPSGHAEKLNGRLVFSFLRVNLTNWQVMVSNLPHERPTA
jgi:hypothetical protein